jgi:hypothetical protein
VEAQWVFSFVRGHNLSILTPFACANKDFLRFHAEELLQIAGLNPRV